VYIGDTDDGLITSYVLKLLITLDEPLQAIVKIFNVKNNNRWPVSVRDDGRGIFLQKLHEEEGSLLNYYDRSSMRR